MGHLLTQLNLISSKQIQKYKHESQKIGKSSFAYAWVFDESNEERERGITIDCANINFETKNRFVNLVDAPGHKDFIPNMITGAFNADSAILVINTIKGEFETGFDLGGQTREHALLVRALGVTQLIVALNKMDMIEWSQERYNDICKKLSLFLKVAGYRDNDIQYIPCSGLLGENLTKKLANNNNNNWYNGICLLDAIDQLKPPERSIDKPLRISINDYYKSTQVSSSLVTLIGKIETGLVRINDKLIIMPNKQQIQLKQILINDEFKEIAYAGDKIQLNVLNADLNKITNGNFICDPLQQPLMQYQDRLKAKIIIFNTNDDILITNGYLVEFHYKTLYIPAIIKKLIAQIDKSTGEIIKERPRLLTKGQSAIIEIKLNESICMELYQNFKELGRFMLRSKGVTIAAGLINEFSDKKTKSNSLIIQQQNGNH
jgi:elongation factor 1 alpha-like protein